MRRVTDARAIQLADGMPPTAASLRSPARLAAYLRDFVERTDEHSLCLLPLDTLTKIEWLIIIEALELLDAKRRRDRRRVARVRGTADIVRPGRKAKKAASSAPRSGRTGRRMQK